MFFHIHEHPNIIKVIVQVKSIKFIDATVNIIDFELFLHKLLHDVLSPVQW